MRDTPGFEPGDYPLRQAGLIEWEGFLMLNIGEEPEPFAPIFEPLSAKFAPWDLGNLRLGRPIEYDVKALPASIPAARPASGT